MRNLSNSLARLLSAIRLEKFVSVTQIKHIPYYINILLFGILPCALLMIITVKGFEFVSLNCSLTFEEFWKISLHFSFRFWQSELRSRLCELASHVCWVRQEVEDFCKRSNQIPCECRVRDYILWKREVEDLSVLHSDSETWVNAEQYIICEPKNTKNRE